MVQSLHPLYLKRRLPVLWLENLITYRIVFPQKVLYSDCLFFPVATSCPVGNASVYYPHFRFTKSPPPPPHRSIATASLTKRPCSFKKSFRLLQPSCPI